MRLAVRDDRAAAAALLDEVEPAGTAAPRPRLHHLLPPRQRRRAGPPRPRPGGAPARRRRLAAPRRWRGSRRGRGRRAGASCESSCATGSRSARSSPPTRPRPRAAPCSRSCASSPMLLDDARGGARRRRRRARTIARLEELIDLLWQTDEIRVARPEVLDEARNAVYYFDELAAGPIPEVLEELDRPARRLGLEPPLEPPPLRVRQLDRRRPRRQPERHAPSDTARCWRSSTSTGSAAPPRSSTSCAATSRSRPGSRRRLPSWRPRWPPTSTRCRSSTRATAASTPRSPTG